MTVATGYLGKRAYHGPLAKHSPYQIAPVTCLGPCGKIYESSCEIMDELCHQCFLKGWRLDKNKMLRRRLEVVTKL